MNWETFWHKVGEFCLSVGGRLLAAGLLLLIGFRLIGWMSRRLHRGKLAKKMDHTVSSFFSSALSITAKTLLVITAIGILGVPMSSVVTVLATAGAAIGLALQGSLSNFAGGIMLLIFKPFHVEDYIETQDVSGTVREINIFYTILQTPDNKNITLPNGTLMNSTIINYSANDTRRVEWIFSVAYGSDVDRVREVIASVLQEYPQILKEPAPMIVLSKQNESSLDISTRVWCPKSEYWTLYFAVNEAMKKAFDANGIEIPFRQVDVHIRDGKVQSF